MKITIDGKEYDLDIEQAKELNLLVEVWKPVKLGDKFLLGTLREEYMLCCPMAGHICMIDTVRGERWSDCMRVLNPNMPTKEEFLNYVGHGRLFERVTK